MLPQQPLLRVGTDVVYVPRIEQAWQRFGDRFLTKIYTAAERQYCLRSAPHTLHRLAGRWAAKEAVTKALGTGWHGVGYTDIEVYRAPSGAPAIQLHGRAAALLESWHVEPDRAQWQISFSHDRDYAFATAILLVLA
jgi:holo-[acyl-carrier protein] synthase